MAHDEDEEGEFLSPGELIARMMAGRRARRISNDPADYARAVEITDATAQQLVEEIRSKRADIDVRANELRRVKNHLDLLQAEEAALRERLFIRLDDVHPEIGMGASTVRWITSTANNQRRSYYVAEGVYDRE